MNIFADKARLAGTRRIMLEKAMEVAFREGDQESIDIYNMCRCYIEAYEQEREARRVYNEYSTNEGGDKAGA